MGGYVVLLDRGDFLRQGDGWSWTRTERWAEASLYVSRREAELAAMMLVPRDVWWHVESLTDVIGGH